MEYYILRDYEEVLGIVTSGKDFERRVIDAVIDHHGCDDAKVKNKSELLSGMARIVVNIELLVDGYDSFTSEYTLERMPVY